MAKGPLAAPQAQEEDNEEVIGQEGDRGQEGQEGADEAEGSALDTGEEQETGGGEDVDELEAEPPSRGETRFQRLSNENAELKRRLTDLERRPALVQPQVQQGETDEQFNARIQFLSSDERMEQRQIRSEQRFNAQVARLQFNTQVNQDKFAFDAVVAVDPFYKKYAAEVEAKHQELLQQGQLVPREEIFNWLLGKKVKENRGSKGVLEQRKRAKQNVQRQQARPTGGRSDVQGTRGRVSEAEARRKRLENMEL